MSGQPTVGLALIARNEQTTLPGLLDSVRGAFDEIVLLDTGSKDQTVQIFTDWCEAEHAAGRLAGFACAQAAWVDDFAAARNLAHSHLSTDWHCWADCDDIIVGAQNLRALAAQAPAELHGFVCSYDYAQDANGQCVCVLKRERLVRAGKGVWQGRVHEAQHIDGALTEVPPDQVLWRHRKPPEAFKPGRNLRILNAWHRAEPENPRVLMYLGTEHHAQGRVKRAQRYFRRYLAQDPVWDEERAQVHRKYARTLLAQGKPGEAIATAFEAIRLLPAWPDSYLTLAEAHYQLGEYAKAAEWACEVQRRGAPNTMLIINPLEYVVEPLVILAGCHAATGQIEEAVRVGMQALQIAPGHPVLTPVFGQWRKTLKRETAAKLVLDLARCLVAHDEQLRAVAVLDAAPHFCRDHPDVAQLRSLVRERVNTLTSPALYADHYENGGSKPEDAVQDYLAVGDSLPRCHFLLAGLQDQLQAA